VTIGTFRPFCHNAPRIIYQGIDALILRVQHFRQLSNVIEPVKVTHKRCPLHKPRHLFRAGSVATHHGNSPRSPRKLTRDFGAYSTTGTGDDCGAVHESCTFWRFNPTALVPFEHSVLFRHERLHSSPHIVRGHKEA